MSRTRMTTLPFLLLVLSPFMSERLSIDFVSTLYIKDPLEYFYDRIILGRM